MKLYIKQRVFSWTDTYDVYDEEGEPRYTVKTEFLTLGHQIHVYHKQTNQELGSIHQHPFAWLPAFEIVINGRSQGEIRRKFSPFFPSYSVDFRGWQVEGDFFGWDYRVLQQGTEILSISKELLTWGDTYTMRYADRDVEFPGLLLVIAIDAANCSGG